MGGLNAVYSSVMVGTLLLCFMNLVAAYPRLDAKDKDFDQDTDSNFSEEKQSPDQMLNKRIFDPIEAASNFGSFGKRYNPYRVLGYGGQLNNAKSLEASNIADILKQVLALARQGQYKRGFPQKRQFDPIGYGMFARFG